MLSAPAVCWFCAGSRSEPVTLKWFSLSAVAELRLHGCAKAPASSSNGSCTEQGYAENLLPSSVRKTTRMFSTLNFLYYNSRLTYCVSFFYRRLFGIESPVRGTPLSSSHKLTLQKEELELSARKTIALKYARGGRICPQLFSTGVARQKSVLLYNSSAAVSAQGCQSAHWSLQKCIILCIKADANATTASSSLASAAAAHCVLPTLCS